MELTKPKYVPEGQAWCPGCKCLKDLSSFASDKKRSPGRRSRCRACLSYARQYLKWRKSPQQIEAARLENKRKVAQATLTIRKLVAAGKLRREPCFLCGAVPVEGNHINYDYPEKVVWLCIPHHKEFHRVFKHTPYLHSTLGTRTRSDNTTGYPGLYWSAKRKKWIATVMVNRKRRYLGAFDTEEDGYAAYLKAKPVRFPPSLLSTGTGG